MLLVLQSWLSRSCSKRGAVCNAQFTLCSFVPSLVRESLGKVTPFCCAIFSFFFFFFFFFVWYLPVLMLPFFQGRDYREQSSAVTVRQTDRQKRRLNSSRQKSRRFHQRQCLCHASSSPSCDPPPLLAVVRSNAMQTMSLHVLFSHQHTTSTCRRVAVAVDDFG